MYKFNTTTLCTQLVQTSSVHCPCTHIQLGCWSGTGSSQGVSPLWRHYRGMGTRQQLLWWVDRGTDLCLNFTLLVKHSGLAMLLLVLRPPPNAWSGRAWCIIPCEHDVVDDRLSEKTVFILLAVLSPSSHTHTIKPSIPFFLLHNSMWPSCSWQIVRTECHILCVVRLATHSVCRTVAPCVLAQYFRSSCCSVLSPSAPTHN